METLLITVTLVSLTLAIAMSLVAWKLLRAEQARSAARVEALVSMASTHPAPSGAVSQSPVFVPESGDDAEREIGLGREELELPLQVASALDLAEPRIESRPVHRSGVPSRPDAMFDRAVEVGLPGRRWLALAAVALLMAAGVAAAYAWRSPEIVAAVAASRTSTGPGSASPRPLELLSLHHSTGPGGTFTVTGLVQNPPAGESLNSIVAVVYLFDEAGRFFASGRANLEESVFNAGDGSPFVVRIPNVSGVSRYRVGFRRQNGGVVEHIDRRGQVPAGTTGDGAEEDFEPDALTPDTPPELVGPAR